MRSRVLFALALALPAARALHARPLLPAELGALAYRGFCVVPSWVPRADVERIRSDVLATQKHGLLRTATVGNGQRVRTDESIRRSQMCSLIPGPPSRVGCLETRMQLTAAVERLRAELSGTPELSGLLQELTPFQTELAYLHYPPEGYYTRHLDVSATNAGWDRLGRSRADGTSLERWERRRTISMLLYLNSDWDVDRWGGQLRIFSGSAELSAPAAREHASSRSAGGATSALAELPRMLPNLEERCVDVAPEGGTLVLMRSELIEHEVVTTQRQRQCVVGWFRTVRRAAAATVIVGGGELVSSSSLSDVMTTTTVSSSVAQFELLQ